MSDNNTKIYYFGDFQLDADQRILIRKGEFVKIPPKTFDLLLFFIQNDNKVIDKEHLLNAVWPDSFVEEANLSVHIANLRKLLSASENPAVQIGPSQKGGTVWLPRSECWHW